MKSYPFKLRAYKSGCSYLKVHCTHDSLLFARTSCLPRISFVNLHFKCWLLLQLRTYTPFINSFFQPPFDHLRWLQHCARKSLVFSACHFFEKTEAVTSVLCFANEVRVSSLRMGVPVTGLTIVHDIVRCAYKPSTIQLLTIILGVTGRFLMQEL